MTGSTIQETSEPVSREEGEVLSGEWMNEDGQVWGNDWMNDESDEDNGVLLNVHDSNFDDEGNIVE